jgi:Lon protease-like protein
VREIGLFPLGIVLLPGERVPLHIFEARYRELIGECLAEGREFGLLLADEKGAREIGTTAEVVEVLQRFDDGRLDILIEGRDRFRLIEETEARSFRTARVAALEDEADEPTSDEVARCLAAFRRLATAAEAELEEPEPGTERLAYWIGARVDFGVDAKQELLELGSERERVIRLTSFLDRARELLHFTQRARDRAQGNGRVEPPD